MERVGGFPLAFEREALAARMAGAGWPRLLDCTSRARIAAAIVGGSSVEEVADHVDFDAQPDTGVDRAAVFLTACMTTTM